MESGSFKPAARMICCFVFIVITAVGVTDGTLQIQQVIVPTQVMSGSNVVLRCLYKDIPDDDDTSAPSSASVGITMSPVAIPSSLATSPLYSLKWYKGSHEFYRHLPGETPATTVFPWSHFNIEVDPGEPGRVVLRDVGLAAEGVYSCEVSTEGSFHTDTAEANLTVIDVQNEEMIMSQDPLTGEAKPGDRIRWNCTFGQSRPKASLTWLINGEPVTPLGISSRGTGEESRENKRTLQTANSQLEIRSLNERHFKNQWLRVSCVVQIGSIFKRTKEARIRHQLYTGGGGGAGTEAASQRNPVAAVVAGGTNTNSYRSKSSGSVKRPLGWTMGIFGVVLSYVQSHQTAVI